MKRTASLIGATGLIGSHLLQFLVEDSDTDTIKLIVRRPYAHSNPKVQTLVIDFTDDNAYKQAIQGSDLIFCAIGTTNKKVKGNKEAYRKVDFDIPVKAAKFGSETGCKVFAFVSSYGANSKTGNFYLKLKGSVEDAISKMKIPSILAFRPSFLVGKREEFRFGEVLGTLIMRPLSFMMPSGMKPIQAKDVAQAMIASAKQNTKGFHILHYPEMKKLIGT